MGDIAYSGLCEIREIYCNMEGFIPETAAEAYVLQEAKRMYNTAVEFIEKSRAGQPADERMAGALQIIDACEFKYGFVKIPIGKIETIRAALRTTPQASPSEAQPASMSSHAAPDDDQDGGVNLDVLSDLTHTDPNVRKTDEILHDDDLTTVYMCGFHKRDDEVREKDRVIRELVAAIEFMRTKGINASASFVRCAPDAEMRMIQALDAMDLVLTKPENAAVIEKARRKK